MPGTGTASDTVSSGWLLHFGQSTGPSSQSSALESRGGTGTDSETETEPETETDSDSDSETAQNCVSSPKFGKKIGSAVTERQVPKKHSASMASRSRVALSISAYRSIAPQLTSQR